MMPWVVFILAVALVGLVESSTVGTATVALLSDSGSSVSARIQGSDVVGVVCGSLDGTLRLEYVPVSATVSVGDTVVTSGLGGNIPSSVLIGTVSGVSEASSGMYYDIYVSPASEISGGEKVFVITSFDSGVVSVASATDGAQTQQGAS